MASLLVKIILPLLLVLFALMELARRRLPMFSAWVETRLNTNFFLACGLAGALSYACALALTTSLPMGTDAVEATVADVAWLILHGHPLYTTLLAPERYSFLYGPMCYLPFSAAIATFGASLASLKLAVVLLNLALFGVLVALFRKLTGWSGTIVFVGALAACFLMKQIPTLQIRGDVALALFVALALLAVELRLRVVAVAVLPVAAAMALDAKFTACVYLLVPLYLFWKKYGSLTTGFVLVLTGALAALPFGLPVVSLSNYLAWLHEASHHPLLFKLFAMNVVAAIIVVMPAAIGFYALETRTKNTDTGRWQQRIIFILMLLTLAGGVVVGSKVGAGRSHLIPSSIVAFYVAAYFWRSLQGSLPANLYFYKAALLGYAFVILLPAFTECRELWSICYERIGYARAVNRDIALTQAKLNTQSIEIGYNDADEADATLTSLSLFKPQLVFEGGPATLDAAAMFDMGLGGLPVPQATVANVLACYPHVWLIPKGGSPFGLANAFVKDIPKRFPDPSLFGSQFQQAFRATYHRSGSSVYYDIYSCKP